MIAASKTFAAAAALALLLLALLQTSTVSAQDACINNRDEVVCMRTAGCLWHYTAETCIAGSACSELRNKNDCEMVPSLKCKWFDVPISRSADSTHTDGCYPKDQYPTYPDAALLSGAVAALAGVCAAVAALAL